MTRINPFRRRWSLATMLGISVSVLAGSGLLAIVADTAASNDNYVTSSKFTGIADLLIAKGSRPSQQSAPTCPVSHTAYRPGPEAAVLIKSLDINNGILTGPDEVLCLMSRRREANQRVLVKFTNLRDTENECTLSPMDESAADSSCDAGRPGELSRILFATVRAGHPSATNDRYEECRNDWPERLVMDWSTVADDFLCPIQFNTPMLVAVQVRMNPNASEGQRRAAQTDLAMWNVVFTLVVDE